MENLIKALRIIRAECREYSACDQCPLRYRKGEVFDCVLGTLTPAELDLPDKMMPQLFKEVEDEEK